MPHHMTAILWLLCALGLLAPLLQYDVQGSNLIVDWAATGFVLQQNTTIAGAAGWTNAPGGVSHPIAIPLPASGNFFCRLKNGGGLGI